MKVAILGCGPVGPPVTRCTTVCHRPPGSGLLSAQLAVWPVPNPRIKRQAHPHAKPSEFVSSPGLAWLVLTWPVQSSPMPCGGVTAPVAAHPVRPLRPELAAPLGVWPSSQLAGCAGGRADWRLCGDVAVLPRCISLVVITYTGTGWLACGQALAGP
jgi:hypothetical protein